MRVKVEAPAEPDSGFVLMLGNGRRIASGWAIRRRGTGPPDPGRGKRVMFGLGPATKIYIAVEGVDMRKGFDGLYGLVRDRLGHDPLSGHLFLFANRERTRLKVSGVGRQRTVGVREAVGEGPLSLAGRAGRSVAW